MNAKLSNELINYMALMGRKGAKAKWQNVSPEERKRILARVTAARLQRRKQGKGEQSPVFEAFNEGLKMQNESVRKGSR